MIRGILIAGLESSLSAAIAVEAGKRVKQYAAAFIPNKLSVPVRERAVAQSAGDSLIPLSWNPGSPISARTLILAAENRLERIDQAILICTPPSLRRQPEELALADIDTAINDHIKGWFFLVKELTAAFKTHNGGTLVLVLSNAGTRTEKGETPDLMGPSVAASFSSFSSGILASSVGKPYTALGFSSEAGEDTAFAAFIFKILDENSKRNSGKWHRYGKFSFFSR
jgi:NAD(P)-dependent dehydrogenase (short-subunit alcohol dehydrogenase family)